LTASERELYRLVLQCNELTVSRAAEQTGQSEDDCLEALEILQATGVIIAMGDKLYRTGSRLFADWVLTTVFLHSDRKEERTNMARDQVFISYSHQDQRFLDELLTHLTPYLRTGAITAWSDQQIRPGSKWFDEIKAASASTSVAVMLVSADFLASDFIHEHELGPFLKGAEAGGVRILWVLIGDCAWKETSLKDYQSVVSPQDKAFASMTKAKRATAWTRVCEEIKRAAGHP
jgi:hypothetical protein